MKEKLKLTESLENYLVVIMELEQVNKVARAKDIAERLGVQRGSVTGALKNLEKRGLIDYQPYNFITLTKAGNDIAAKVKKRNRVLKDFFLKVLHTDKKTASDTACRMEHIIDDKVMRRLIFFIDYITSCPRTGTDWLQSFTEYCSGDEKNWEKCEKCLDECKARHHEIKMK